MSTPSLIYKGIITLLCAAAPCMTASLQAQELNAKVSINHQKVEGTNTQVFETLETALTEFINERQWTSLQFKRNERINCTFSITVKKYTQADNAFETTFNVQCNRPVYGSNYTSTTWAFTDANCNFTYQAFDQLEFRTDVIDNALTALVAYYVYLMLGIDMDTMAPLAGTSCFQNAQTIALGAQSLPGKGWKAFDDSKNRYAIINDMLDGGMEPFRKMQYAYYRLGLDVMSENVERGRAGVTQAMELLKQARENKPMCMLPQIFSEYKRDELVSIYKGHGTAKEKEGIADLFSRINPSQNAYWRQLKE
ncbi:MAG: DUF4835 family protein [Bacteroidales bacterium]|nr:DUF4835 family protein [Bacteroidales bacterium]MEE0903323.1 DUF4835 family protein [Prevotellamassilia sp.]